MDKELTKLFKQNLLEQQKTRLEQAALAAKPKYIGGSPFLQLFVSCVAILVGIVGMLLAILFLVFWIGAFNVWKG